MMNKKVLAGIISGALVLSMGVAVIVLNVNSNASYKKDVAIAGAVDMDLDEVEEGEVPDHFNILCTIKSKEVAYSEVKDKDLVLCYDVNNQFEGKEKMTMKVVDYEEDKTTPKTVYFESEVVGRECAWIPYTIFTIDKDQVYNKIFSDTYAVSAEELKKSVFENGTYEASFTDKEKASTYDTVVSLKSSDLDPKKVEFETYSALSYSVNDGEYKTVYAQCNVTNKPDTAIADKYIYEAKIFANKGDKIDYKVTIPTKDKDAVYEEEHSVVVK